MRVNYRDFELNAFRDKYLGGWSLLYYDIFQDGAEWVSGFEDSEETVEDKIQQLKVWVDLFYDYIGRNRCYFCEGKLDNMVCKECGEDFTISKDGDPK